MWKQQASAHLHSAEVVDLDEAQTLAVGVEAQVHPMLGQVQDQVVAQQILPTACTMSVMVCSSLWSVLMILRLLGSMHGHRRHQSLLGMCTGALCKCRSDSVHHTSASPNLMHLACNQLGPCVLGSTACSGHTCSAYLTSTQRYSCFLP